ncbi:hypothetical protein [Paenibacillus sp. Y412MC10]|uniref:PBECR3 domain-containing polyvalent protein n=1 Tax=Geobacillus sp. (strain Y412MC10) TaxID=481743 RepID=UPI0011AB4D91|nr:hypothetical protein [Paenibacillus sp. Y412MC10]
MKNNCTSQFQSSILPVSTTIERDKTLGSYHIDINATDIQTVGKLNVAAIKKLIGIEFPIAEVQLYPGAIKHIKRRHPGIIEQHGHLIPGMLAAPDYIGKNPTEPDSIELVKVVTDSLLLAVKLDPSGYLYVSSFYDLNNAAVKLQKRLASGRWVPFQP